ncbi:MAG: hypothetical protein WC986_10015 [Elusimicrobiota bacterium]|jgi:hypothetical protein
MSASRLLLSLLLPAALLLAPSRSAADVVSSADGFTINIGVQDLWPPAPVTDLTGTAGAEGQALLQWTAPEESTGVRPKGAWVASYQLRTASFSVADLGGDTTAWFNLAVPFINPPAPMPPGSLQSALTSLDLGTTFYFGLRSADSAGNVSDIDLRAKNGSTQARVGVKGVQGITDLTALPGTAFGSVDLTWSEPRRIGTIEPSRYEVRVSSTGQISDDAQFLSAKPLTSFSASAVPQPGPAGRKASWTLTGLVPSTTYYFAVRLEDAGAPAFIGTWKRDVPGNRNPFNFATARYIAAPPAPITDLTALPAAGKLGAIDLSWTAPALPGGAPADHYIVKVNTNSVASIGGDTEAWFSLPTSTTLVRSAGIPGVLESLRVTGLSQFYTYYFAIRTVDIVGLTSLVDARTASVSDQAHAQPVQVAAITDLLAVPGTASGDVQLSWTEPASTDLIAPLSFVVKASTQANIIDDAAFAAAQDVSAFSPSPVPSPLGTPNRVAFTLTGLTPFTTYYFAVRMRDSQPLDGVWARIPAFGFNLGNFSAPKHVPNPPEAVTDLAALTGASEGEISLSWSAPRNRNFTTVTSYDVRYATFSAAALAGDATAWFNLASGRLNLAPARAPGALETLTAAGLEPGALYYFGLRSADMAGDVSPVDVWAGSVQVRSRGIQGVTDLQAQTGSSAGDVLLNWTEPGRSGETAPVRYELRMAEGAQIADDAAFAAAQPLASYSATPLPVPSGSFGEPRSLVVTGLSPLATYYFALRAEDSASFIGRWSRAGRNASNYASSLFVPMAPDAVTDLTGLPTSVEGEIALAWSAPRNQNFVPMARYEVRFATFSVAGIGGNAAAWFSLASSSSAAVAPAKVPGGLETLLIAGLNASTTFYFGVRSEDRIAELSLLDARATGGSQAFVKPLNLPPATPSGLIADAGRNRAQVRWNALSQAGKGTDFAFYTLYRSTQAGGPYDLRLSTVGLSLADWPLTAFTTYYYRIGARDQEGLESAPSAAVLALPYTLRPLEPLGQTVQIAASTVSLRWSTVTRFSNGEIFESVGVSTPVADELLGYQILRSTHPCADFALLGVNGVDQTSFTDVANGDVYYYQIHSFNSLGASTDTVVLSSLGTNDYFIDDCSSRVTLRQADVDLLRREVTGKEDDIQLARRRLPAETGEKILQSVEFLPMVGGIREDKDFHFEKPVQIVLHFVTSGGKPVPQDASYSVQEARAQVKTLAAGQDLKDLGMFWHNGVEYKKLYGQVDTLAQTVTVETPNIGKFQIRTLLREQGVTFDLSNITSRIFTPNSDGKNDVVIFLFDNPRRSPVEGKIYDLRGAFVSFMQPGPQPDSLMWDGRMDGRTVTSGVYIYQIHGEGKTFNGTVVVAR